MVGLGGSVGLDAFERLVFQAGGVRVLCCWWIRSELLLHVPTCTVSESHGYNMIQQLSTVTGPLLLRWASRRSDGF